MSTLRVRILPLLGDNYSYVLVRDRDAAVVDPADGEAVYREIRERDLHLRHVLLTHHHRDHTAGVHVLKKKTGCAVWGGNDKRFSECDTALADGEVFEVLGCGWSAMHLPGHTRSHLAYYCAGEAMVFTGDVLFVGGCGRLMEGTAAQMWASLRRLAALPDNTRVYCGHEYTEENYTFACAIAAHEPCYAQRLVEVRMQLNSGQPTVPSTIAMERRNNIFLRAGNVDDFAALRRRKDSF